MYVCGEAVVNLLLARTNDAAQLLSQSPGCVRRSSALSIVRYCIVVGCGFVVR